MERSSFVCGDSFDLMVSIPDNSIDLVITSPPYYQQREYGKGMGNEDTPEEYIQSLLTLFGQCVRVIKPTGSIVFNMGDKYIGGGLCFLPYRFAIAAIANYPVNAVNAITWVKKNPTPRQFARRLVSSTEPFFHFVKSKDYAYYPEGFCAVARPGRESKPSSRLGSNYTRLIDKSDLSLPEKEAARIALSAVVEEVKSGRLAGFRMKIRGIHSRPFGGQSGGRNNQIDRDGFTIIRVPGNPMKKDVIETPVESIRGCPHPAVYPSNLIQEFVRLLTKKGDTVLDPFAGVGSTAVAAAREGRRYICFEINQAYVSYAIDRINKEKYG